MGARFYVDWRDREGVVRKHLPVLDVLHIPNALPGGISIGPNQQRVGIVTLLLTVTPDMKRFQIVSLNECVPSEPLVEGPTSSKG